MARRQGRHRDRVRPHPVTWEAIALVTTGIIVIFASSMGGGRLFGDLCAVGGACATAGTLTAIRRARPEPLPALIPGALLAGAAATWWAQPSATPAGDIPYLALLGLVLLPCALGLVFGALRWLGSSEVALLMLLETVLAPICVWLVLNELPSLEIVLAGGLIVATVGAHAVVVQRRHAAILS